MTKLSYVGRSIPRREDQRLLTGRGQFIADLKQVLLAGARPLGTVAGTLSAGRRDAEQILRNLTYLIAGGALTPFAIRLPDSRGGRRATRDRKARPNCARWRETALCRARPRRTSKLFPP